MYIILSWLLEHAYCLFCSLLHLKPCAWQSPTPGREEKIFPSSERTEDPYKVYRCKEMLIIEKNDTIQWHITLSLTTTTLHANVAQVCSHWSSSHYLVRLHLTLYITPQELGIDFICRSMPGRIMAFYTLPNTPGGILEAKRADSDLGHIIWKGKMIFLICPEIPLSIRKLEYI